MGVVNVHTLWWQILGKWPFVGGVALPDSAMVLPECSIHLLVQLGLDRREQGFGRLVRTAEDRGRVAYDYQIGTYDVTIGQYADFLNAVAAGKSGTGAVLFGTGFAPGSFGNLG